VLKKLYIYLLIQIYNVKDKIYNYEFKKKALSYEVDAEIVYPSYKECPNQDRQFANSYQFICNPKTWQYNRYAEQLPELVEFIKQLPFKGTGRITLIFDTGGHVVAPTEIIFIPNIVMSLFGLEPTYGKSFIG